MSTTPIAEMTHDELTEELKNLLLAYHEMSQEIEFVKKQQKDLQARIKEVNAAFYSSFDPSTVEYVID